MADEKQVSHDEPHQLSVEDTQAALPSGWLYKGFKIGNKRLWYASPQVQITMVAFVCFMCPGKQ
jgi:hypothetical protein